MALPIFLKKHSDQKDLFDGLDLHPRKIYLYHQTGSKSHIINIITDGFVCVYVTDFNALLSLYKGQVRVHRFL